LISVADDADFSLERSIRNIRWPDQQNERYGLSKAFGKSSACLMMAEYSPGNGALVNLVRTIVDPRCSLMSPEIGEDRVISHSQGTVSLECPVDHLHENISGIELDE